MEPESRTNGAIPIPQVIMPTNAPKVMGPDWEHRTPCERTFIAIFLEHIIPMTQIPDGRAWRRYAVYPARTDDLVMTAIALLYSSHMNLPGVGGFAHLYQDHFAKLLSVREKTHLFSDDENLKTVAALLIVLISQATGSRSVFLKTESKLVEILEGVILRSQTEVTIYDGFWQRSSS
ncbi:hypothetical protein FNAPI_3794 [Fusarium napiforme]|uniref:Transcription factor n=1 Tax=Fusarium napiforme TaxID=42672 RepID=A0A8H5JVK6_9HYPO|nr:hypothetical protein FNAPI_3794 [Fusarium napiforme]